MPDMGAGPRLFTQGLDVASLSLTPQVPNAALVRSIGIANISGPDTWVVRTNGQEVGRFRIVGNDVIDFLGNNFGDQAFYEDIFTYCKQVLGVDLVYPVPEGKVLTFSSVGGATADIAFQYEEFNSSALNPSIANYPGGTYWVATVLAHVTTPVAAPGEVPYDTEISLDFVPDLFVRQSFPQGWNARVLDVFTVPAGVNTYNGSADHQSRTTHIYAKKSGQRLFTRDADSGVPLVSYPSATGSANITNSNLLTAYQPLTEIVAAGLPNLPEPIQYRPGYVYEWGIGVVGDTTGGADYSSSYIAAIVEYRSA